MHKRKLKISCLFSEIEKTLRVLQVTQSKKKKTKTNAFRESIYTKRKFLLNLKVTFIRKYHSSVKLQDI